ncbi:MAG: S8 family serine peptidase [Phycisphaerales bacterium]|nr:S8 family serine peptidase [Phycisphaerales bacterium]
MAQTYSPHLDAIGFDELLTHPQYGYLTGGGQTIAVLDTGIDPNHLMFSDGRIVTGINFASGVSPLAPPTYADGNRHGTFVSSVASSVQVFATVSGGPLILDNQTFSDGTSIMLGGVSTGANLAAVRVLDNDGNGNFDDILAGLQWVRDNYAFYNITVVNMSLGTNDTFIEGGTLVKNDALVGMMSATIDQLNALGVAVVAASGNSGDPDGISFPAILDNVISVGASEYDNDGLAEILAPFTNRNNRLDVLAPGRDVLGAFARDVVGDPTNELAIGSGTSFATPAVAGAITLINEYAIDRWGQAPNNMELMYLLQQSDTFIFDDVSGLSFPRLDLINMLDIVDSGSYIGIPEPMSLSFVLLLGTMVCSRRRA